MYEVYTHDFDLSLTPLCLAVLVGIPLCRVHGVVCYGGPQMVSTGM
jgi:hypothetical protein